MKRNEVRRPRECDAHTPRAAEVDRPLPLWGDAACGERRSADGGAKVPPECGRGRLRRPERERENGGVKPPGLGRRPRPCPELADADWFRRPRACTPPRFALPTCTDPRPDTPQRGAFSKARARRTIAPPSAGGSSGVGGAPQGDALLRFARERTQERRQFQLRLAALHRPS